MVFPGKCSRRQVLAGAAGLLATGTVVRPIAARQTTPTTSGGKISATDVIGRVVTIDQPAQRIVVTSRTGFYVVAMLDKDNPFQRIVAWNDDLLRTDKDSYDQYVEKFPAAKKLPTIGQVGGADFNAEKILDLQADLIVIDLTGYQTAKENGLIDKLAAAKIATVVVDFREQMLENTIPSVQVLGRLLGRNEVATAFSDFFLQEANKVYNTVSAMDPKRKKVSAFIQRAPGVADTGLTFGKGNLGAFIDRAGGVNWAEQYVGEVHGTVNPEQILVGDFDELILTGANWEKSANRGEGHFISLGYEAKMDKVQEAIKQVIADAHWQDLPAVKNGKVFAIWHQFYVSPYSFIALQQFAKWLYPDLYQDVDPAADFRRLHEQFLPIPYQGIFFAQMGVTAGPATPASGA